MVRITSYNVCYTKLLRYRPNSGSARVAGKVTLLAGLGAGFTLHLTGRENIFLIIDDLLIISTILSATGIMRSFLSVDFRSFGNGRLFETNNPNA